MYRIIDSATEINRFYFHEKNNFKEVTMHPSFNYSATSKNNIITAQDGKHLAVMTSETVGGGGTNLRFLCLFNR